MTTNKPEKPSSSSLASLFKEVYNEEAVKNPIHFALRSKDEIHGQLLSVTQQLAARSEALVKAARALEAMLLRGDLDAVRMAQSALENAKKVM